MVINAGNKAWISTDRKLLPIERRVMFCLKERSVRRDFWVRVYHLDLEMFADLNGIVADRQLSIHGDATSMHRSRRVGEQPDISRNTKNSRLLRDEVRTKKQVFDRPILFRGKYCTE
jgi:hypothetical protein